MIKNSPFQTINERFFIKNKINVDIIHKKLVLSIYTINKMYRYINFSYKGVLS